MRCAGPADEDTGPVLQGLSLDPPRAWSQTMKNPLAYTPTRIPCTWHSNSPPPASHGHITAQQYQVHAPRARATPSYCPCAHHSRAPRGPASDQPSRSAALRKPLVPAKHLLSFLLSPSGRVLGRGMCSSRASYVRLDVGVAAEPSVAGALLFQGRVIFVAWR